MEMTTDFPEIYNASNGDFQNQTEGGENEIPTQRNSSVFAEAAQMLIYKVGFGIHIYWLPVITIIGIIGNTLALVIMLKKHNRILSCCLYMAALAVSDNVCLFIMGYYWVKPTFKVPIFHRFECQSLGYALLTAAQFGMLMIVAMTFDRFVVVRFSLSKFRMSHSNPKRAVKVIGILLIFAMVFNIPHFILLDTGVKYACITFSGDSVWVKVYAFMSIIFNAFLPFISLLTMNIVIIKTIRQAHKHFDIGAEFSRFRGAPKEAKKDPSEKEQAQLTIMLLLVNFVFLILCMPVYIRYITYTIVDYKSDPAILATYVLVYHITHKLYYTNSAVNFFLYYVGGSKFRKELKQLFVNIKESVTPTVSTASSSV